jgi:hypothetical protein
MTNEFKPIRTTADRAPENKLEALMMTKPFEEPETSQEELMVLREAVAIIVDQLEERDLWIINACISERKSLQAIANELGITKTHVWRLRNAAFEKLKGVMATDTTIRKTIRLADTWDQSAMQWVMYLAGIQDERCTSIDIPLMQETIESLAEIYWEQIDTVQRPQRAFESLALMAIHEMRLRETWDTGHMVATLCKKQHDYGHGNILKFGTYGVIVRMSDKIERYANLTKLGHQAQNESTNDTLLDIVGYTVIALMLMDDTFKLHLGDDYGFNTGHE